MNTFEIQLPGREPIQVAFCCPLPEPAYRMASGPMVPGQDRSQAIECMNCGTTIVRSSWTPVRPRGEG